jgi:predicted GNAT family acetyltransferase
MMGRMSFVVRRHASVDEFLAAAGDFLGVREAEHNLLFGILSWVRASPELLTDGPASFATVTHADGRIAAATLRTPPHNQVLSWVDEVLAVDALVDALRDEPLPGVLGPTKPVARFATGWTNATGQPARLQLAERIFRLERVIQPERPATGTWRVADRRDRDLIARWLVEFLDEAMPEGPPLPDPVATADRWVAQVGRIGYVWEDADEVVSLVGASGETPHGIRIGPVYTPPPRRSRGYASALTAAASQDQLDRGRQFVFLFTDLSNPTSNKIYRAIGYEPVCDVDVYRFGADA